MEARQKKQSVIIIAKNKAARFEYFVLETEEVGIVLSGAEVKSLRLGKVNLSDSFCFFEHGELILKNCNISSYEKGSFFNLDPKRDRKLLLHKRQISRFYSKTREKGLTLVPLSIYFKGSLVKLELGLCEGKKTYDKKEVIKERDLIRQANRDIKEYS